MLECWDARMLEGWDAWKPESQKALMLGGRYNC